MGKGGSDGSVPIRERHDWAAVRPSIAVVTALAAIEGVDATELSTKRKIRLYDYVDPGALDTLIGCDRGIEISFRVDDYRVRIDGDELTILAD